MKPLLMISYDLNKAASEEYKALDEYLRSIADTGVMTPLESVYFIQTEKSVDEVNKGIRALLIKEEGNPLRSDTKWFVAPIKLGSSAGYLDDVEAAWWKKAVSQGL
ncbi:hypothetical protein GO986_18610 [Deinococcus sp. HMF7620]|uniref:Uncharacterized protein n=1 Tax=Deinococcus arboris TaxID=2682977 RepID=A0A7C9HTQ3_9DEIO|nr:hypothetical protein [Deinococcus arboris]MVN88754.1 hypothetical protein [Deinococcus arboris]